MFGEKLLPPIKVGNVVDPASYYRAFSGSQLVCRVLDKTNNLVARGMGVSFSESYQMTPILEWANRKSIEVVDGMALPGQVQIQTMQFMQLNDSLWTARDLPNIDELTTIVQVADEEKVSIKGLVIDVFSGCKIQAQNGNWTAQGLYTRTCSLIYRERITGLQWAAANTDLFSAASDHAAYPANVAS